MYSVRRKRTRTLKWVNGWVGSEKIMNGERRRNSLVGGVGMSPPTALCENRKKHQNCDFEIKLRVLRPRRFLLCYGRV